LVSLLLVLGSCSADKPSASPVQRSAAGVSASVQVPAGPTDFGSFTLEISPREPNRQTTLGVTAVGFYISSANIQWLLDGNPVSTEVPAQFNCSIAAKGSTVQARATVLGQEVRSNIVAIRNSPPKITRVRLLPEVFKPGDTLSIEVEGTDPDGDPVSILYEWIRNGSSAGRGSTIEGPVRRGDEITITVIPNDGEAFGNPSVLTREIQNMPPMFVEHKNFNFAGGIWSFQAKVVDPDGDIVRFSLASAPEGMKIDPLTGEMIWNVPSAFKGAQDVTIAADDGHGGTSRYSLTINIQGQ
jgi:hypothetical protein